MFDYSTEWLLFTAAVLMIGSVVGGSISTRLGVPALIAFLGLGMVAGSDGAGGIPFEDYGLAKGVGVTALVLILFSGGLSTSWRSVRSVLGPALMLSTVGVVISTGVVAATARGLLGFSWTEGILLGAIVASTDAAAVFAALSAGDLALSEDTRVLLEVESGANDPIAAFVVVACIAVLKGGHASLAALAPEFALQMLFGLGVGLAVGLGFVRLFSHRGLRRADLGVALGSGAAFLAYSAAALLGGSGFLAVYVAGIVVASRRFADKLVVTRFHEGLAWIAQVVMFLTLGLLVFPSSLPGVAVPGLVSTAVLIFLARPAAVFACLALFSRFDWRTRLFISWCGLRGAAPIVLATFPMLAGVPRAKTLFDVVFFVVLASSLVQGPLLARLARWLRLDGASPPRAGPRPSLDSRLIPGVPKNGRMFNTASRQHLISRRPAQ
jgi:cell volume regulation protein A